MSSTLPTISLCMIVKNEEALLAGCLASAAPFVDQIVVVDTGSSDRTPEIARQKAHLFLREPWQGDFSAARNASIAPASGDWVLILDADERLEAAGAARLKALLAGAGGPGYTLTMLNHAAGGGLTQHQVARLFKNGLGLKFSGRIHEQLNWPAPPQPLPVVVHHLGYAGDEEARAAKGRQRLAMLRERVARDPADFNARVHLARALLVHGQEPEQVLAQGRAALELAAAGGQPPEALPWAMYPMMRALFQLGRHQELGQMAQVAVGSHPTWPDGWFALLLARFNLGQWAAALKAAETFLALQERWAREPHAYPHRQNATLGESGAALWYACLAAARLGKLETMAGLAGRLARSAGRGKLEDLRQRLVRLGLHQAAQGLASPDEPGR